MPVWAGGLVHGQADVYSGGDAQRLWACVWDLNRTKGAQGAAR
jgi:hypothetical protein